jgi:hypothetical protein
MALFYEKQLNSYIARYFGVYPEIGWTMDLMANRGRE